MSALLLLALTGCQYLEEQRVDPEVIDWDGTILAQVSTEAEVQVLDEGSVTLHDLDGALLAEAETDGSGYWRFNEVPVNTEVAIRLQGVSGGSSTLPEMTPTLWRGLSPSGRATWLSGGLFLRDLAYTEDFLSTLEGFPGTSVTPLSEGTVAHLWGEPWEPERWADAEVVVTDGAGEDAELLLLVIQEDGTIAEAQGGEPVDLFIAIDLAPGEVQLSVTTTTGAQAQETWPAEGGDLLSAIFFALPEEG